jgi:hypothetical protein
LFKKKTEREPVFLISASKVAHDRIKFAVVFIWLPRSRNRMTIYIERSHKRNTFVLWFRFPKKC